MTMPDERTMAIFQTRQFLQELLDPKQRPNVPGCVRQEARRLLRHYPLPMELSLAHDALPFIFGAPPTASEYVIGKTLRD